MQRQHKITRIHNMRETRFTPLALNLFVSLSLGSFQCFIEVRVGCDYKEVAEKRFFFLEVGG
jgi:hypothetical protein